MTIFGPDISSYQHGVNLGALSDPFVLAKATEGTYYTDADYSGWRQQAASLGKLFCWYHFLSGEDAHAQVAHTTANVGDLSLPGMLDFEPTGSFRPTLAQAIAYIDAAHAAGLNLKLVYLPHWYWQQIGSPDLSPLADRGVALVSSSYPGGSGYPGDNAAGWQSYGGMTPLLYQFTDSAVVGGQTVGDRNAYRGTVEQLAAFLGATTPISPTGGTIMGTIPPSIPAYWPDVPGFPAGGSFDNDTALIWADAGARAGALYAKQARDAINALAGRIGQPPTVDVGALASAVVAAVVPHIPPGIDQAAFTSAVVAAVEAHAPGTVDLAALATLIDSHIQLKAV